MGKNSENWTFKAVRAALIAIVLGAGISFGFKAWLAAPGNSVSDLVHSWVVVPSVLIVGVIVFRSVQMAKSNTWGCLPTIIFLAVGIAVWLIPLGH